MSRRKHSTSAQRGLESLKNLRARIALAPAARPSRSDRAGAGAGKAEKPESPAPPTAPPQDAATGLSDHELFRRSLGEITPIQDGGRVELERPRPAPVPRPRPPDPEPEPAAEALRPTEPLDDASLFRASMADVMPLADLGRIDLSGERARHQRLRRAQQADPLAKPGLDELSAALPSSAVHLDGEALFQHAMRDIQPLSDSNRVEPEPSRPSPEPRKRREDEDAALRESLELPITLEDRLEMGDETVFLRPGLPRRVLVDLRRGRWVLQGELDLHGCTREEAREALSRFLASSLQRGARCVRVIHGKGLGSPGRVSILKQLSRGWLAQREEILAFCQASPNQGGSGALMVLLRGTPSPHSSSSPRHF